MSKQLFEDRSCVFSECRTYRFRLDIVWDAALPVCNFIMLNPSTADELVNDPTVERCQRRAAEWGFGRLVVTNLFAFRATDPKEMLAVADPVGLDNDRHIAEAAREAKLVICGWGIHGKHRGRSNAVRTLLSSLNVSLTALRLCQDGEPGHPLYVGYGVRPEPWTHESVL